LNEALPRNNLFPHRCNEDRDQRSPQEKKTCCSAGRLMLKEAPKIT